MDGVARSVWVTADDVDEALQQIGLRADGAALSASRSRPIGLDGLSLDVRLPKQAGVAVDGATTMRTTTAATVGDLLAEAGVAVRPADALDVPAATPSPRGWWSRSPATTPARSSRRCRWPSRRCAPPTRASGRQGPRHRGGPAGHRAAHVQRRARERRGDRPHPGVGRPRRGPRRPAGRASARRPKPAPAPAPAPAPRAAAAAPAAPSSAGGLNWAALARCESGGNPHAVGGGGRYFGLYQFSLSTWAGVGGSRQPGLRVGGRADLPRPDPLQPRRPLALAGLRPQPLTRRYAGRRDPDAGAPAHRPGRPARSRTRLGIAADQAAGAELRHRPQHRAPDRAHRRVGPDDVVVEVGPGLGSLTLGAAGRGRPGWSPSRSTRCSRASCRRPSRATCRTGPTGSRWCCGRAALEAVPGPAPTAFVANLPYNVAVPVLLRLLERLPSLRTGLVMVQAEVADRLGAGPGSKTYGVPSVKAAWYADVRRAGAVGRTVFWPAPHVDSGLVAFTRREPPAGGPGGDVRRRGRRLRPAAQDAAGGAGRLGRLAGGGRAPAGRCGDRPGAARGAAGGGRLRPARRGPRP